MNHLNEKRHLLNSLADFFGLTASNASAEASKDDDGLRNCETPGLAHSWPSTKELADKLKELSINICGGAITSVFTAQRVNDIDMYLEDPSKLQDAIKYLSTTLDDKPFFSPNCIGFTRRSKNGRRKWTVQLITRFTGPPATIFDDFDFTITTGAYSFRLADFVFGDRFLADVAARRLVFMGNSHFPICAMYRTKKYQRRGYTLSGATIMHISLSIVRLKIETYKQLKEQLLGIDTIFLQHLLSQDHFDENLPVDYGRFIADALDFMSVHVEADE